MNSESLFTLALGLQSPWEVRGVEFAKSSEGRNELHIQIGFVKGAKFPDSTGALCGVHDTQTRKWQHLNFFEHTCYLHCDVPRIKATDGKVKLVPVPWSRPGSGFTLLFEAMAMALIGKRSTNPIYPFFHPLLICSLSTAQGSSCSISSRV